MSIQRHKSTCPYCGFGCGLMVAVEGGKVVEVRGMKGHPVNDGDICVLAANLPPVFTAECSTRLCMASTAVGLLSTVGADAPPTCYADVEQSDHTSLSGTLP